MTDQKTQLLVIGAGPGGYTAAFLAADRGLQVTLVDLNREIGGVCLSRGCIPSKALLHTVKIISEAKDAQEFGLEFTEPKIHIDKVRDWKNSIVSKLTSGLEQLCKQREVNFIQGRASFTNSDTVKVKEASGQETNISFDHAIVATGTFPVTLPFAPASEKVINSTQALDLKDIPQNMLIVGGGYIGLELGSVYSALGVQISVVEMTDTLLPGCDPDLTRILERRLKQKFKSILTGTTVTKIEKNGEEISVTFEDKKEKVRTGSFNKVLISIGRKPRPQALGLENTKVEVDKKGFIKVNGGRKTDDPKIWAAGDIVGGPMLAHKASAEGRVAVKNILGDNISFGPKAIPCSIFTDPEIAWCGLTELEAKEKNIPVKIAKFPWAASGRSATLNRSEGVTKLIIDPDTEKILGVGIAGYGAGELISEGVVAIEKEMTVSEMTRIIHPHPTLSETILEAAESYFGESANILNRKK